jgi:hypothetical protein
MDETDTLASDMERRTARLPPYAQDLLAAADSEHAPVWRVISPFADDAVNPCDLAREWAVSPPAVLDGLSAVGRLVVGELLRAYGQREASVDQMDAAVQMGATPRARWVFRLRALGALGQRDRDSETG